MTPTARLSSRPGRRRWLAAGLLALSGAAHAHTGHGIESFATGLAHPFGLDHLLAMVAVGLWSVAALGGMTAWRGPLAFMLCMAAGAGLGLQGLELSFIETAVSGSVVLLGGLLVLGAGAIADPRRAVGGGLWLVAAAGLLHGLAHGSDAPVDGHALTYAAGMLVTTGVLHTAGVALGIAVALLDHAAWRERLHRAAGIGLGAAGLLMMAATG